MRERGRERERIGEGVNNGEHGVLSSQQFVKSVEGETANNRRAILMMISLFEDPHNRRLEKYRGRGSSLGRHGDYLEKRVFPICGETFLDVLETALNAIEKK